MKKASGLDPRYKEKPPDPREPPKGPEKFPDDVHGGRLEKDGSSSVSATTSKKNDPERWRDKRAKVYAGDEEPEVDKAYSKTSHELGLGSKERGKKSKTVTTFSFHQHPAIQERKLTPSAARARSRDISRKKDTSRYDKAMTAGASGTGSNMMHTAADGIRKVKDMIDKGEPGAKRKKYSTFAHPDSEQRIPLDRKRTEGVSEDSGRSGKKPFRFGKSFSSTPCEKMKTLPKKQDIEKAVGTRTQMTSSLAHKRPQRESSHLIKPSHDRSQLWERSTTHPAKQGTQRGSGKFATNYPHGGPVTSSQRSSVLHGVERNKKNQGSGLRLRHFRKSEQLLKAALPIVKALNSIIKAYTRPGRMVSAMRNWKQGKSAGVKTARDYIEHRSKDKKFGVQD